MQPPGTAQADTHVIQAVHAQVGRLGVPAASKALGLGRETVIRILAGLPVRPGTLALLRERLAAQLSTVEPQP
jgi:hypothetical protein